MGYVDLNRVFPGNVNGNITEQIAAAITEILDAFQPEVILDLHESFNSYADGPTYLGNTIITPAAYSLYAYAAADAINESGLTPELDFKPLEASTSGMISTTYSARYDAPTFTLETTRRDDAAAAITVPYARRVRQQRFLIDALMKECGAL